MNLALLLWVAGFLLAGGEFRPVQAESVVGQMDQLRGEDWVRFNRSQKEYFVQAGIGGLEGQGVYFLKPYSFYVEELDRAIAAERSFLGQYLDNLFVFCVFENEPQSRAVINRIRSQNQSQTEKRDK